jgi:hypothetical protein
MTNDEQVTTRPQSPLKRFFSNPVVGVVGSIASIISVVLAVYFFLASRETRELTYFVHPVKSIIVSSGKSSQISVAHENESITTDVTATQIAFWNAGRESIRKDNVLRPFVIKVGDQVPILETRIRKKSREVVEILIDEEKAQQGELSIGWNILEQYDGAAIQLVFAGPPDTRITADAVIEGQSGVEGVQFTGTIRSPGEQYARAGREYRVQGWVFLGMGVVMLFPMTYITLRLKHRRGLRLTDWVAIIQPLVFVIMAIFFLLKSQLPGPPFGFE